MVTKTSVVRSFFGGGIRRGKTSPGTGGYQSSTKGSLPFSAETVQRRRTSRRTFYLNTPPPPSFAFSTRSRLHRRFRNA